MKKEGEGGEQQQRNRQQKHFLNFSFMKLQLECGKEFFRNFPTGRRNVRALETHAFSLINAEYQRPAI